MLKKRRNSSNNGKKYNNVNFGKEINKLLNLAKDTDDKILKERYYQRVEHLKHQQNLIQKTKTNNTENEKNTIKTEAAA